MQFLNAMNSPCFRLPPSLPPYEPERIGPYVLGPVIVTTGFSTIYLQQELLLPTLARPYSPSLHSMKKYPSGPVSIMRIFSR